MTDKIWWPSKPDDNSHKEKVDRWIVELEEMWDGVEPQPSAVPQLTPKKFRLHQMFDPDNQDDATVHVGVKDDVLMSWVVSHKPNLEYDDSRVIFDNTEEFI